jgi:hypothetical protein
MDMGSGKPSAKINPMDGHIVIIVSLLLCASNKNLAESRRPRESAEPSRTFCPSF